MLIKLELLTVCTLNQTSLVACVGGNTDAGQQVFWWNLGLLFFIAINPLALDKVTVLVDAQCAAIAIDSAVQRNMWVLPSDSDNNEPP